MRLIKYYVMNKNTYKTVYSDCRRKACEEYLAKMANSEEYGIAYKWVSI